MPHWFYFVLPPTSPKHNWILFFKLPGSSAISLHSNVLYNDITFVTGDVKNTGEAKQNRSISSNNKN